MKQLLLVLPAALIAAANIYAQDAAGTQIPTAAQTPDAPDKYGTGSNGYGSEGYGGRAEVFMTGFGMLTSSGSGNSINHAATESGGFAAGYRFHLNSWSALEGSYGFVRNSHKYDVGGAVSSIPTYLSEITGSYVYRFPKLHRIQPFLEGGGGLIHISPGNYGNSSNSSGAATGSGAGGVSSPSPYPFASVFRVAVPAAANIDNGVTSGVASQTRPAFLYGAGVDFPAFSRFSFRLEYRGLGYKTPDFNVTGLQTNAYSFLYEPSFGMAYRF